MVASFALNRARIREIPVQKPAPGVMISFPFLRKLRSISVSNLCRKTFVLSQDTRLYPAAAVSLLRENAALSSGAY